MNNTTPSSKAQDRQISVWLEKIRLGEIKLPRFQRHQAWDKNRICSLLETITANLPLGITLILNVSEEKFVSRYLATAPETKNRVTEHLLDGQQRLTSLWRALHNNYDGVKYFMYFKKYDKYYDVEEEGPDVSIHHRGRWKNKRGELMPKWADSPSDMFLRGMVPMELFYPGNDDNIVKKWVDEAIEQYRPDRSLENYSDLLESWMESKSQLKDVITAKRTLISHFNLPFLALPSTTNKDTALQVFINMNTNSKPLSQYDIIRAEIEGVEGVSLDDLENQLRDYVPKLESYVDLSTIVLNTSSLMQGKLPSQRGAWDMDKVQMVKNWQSLMDGLKMAVSFLENEGIYDSKRLPTSAPIAVIGALFTRLPSGPDERGRFFTLMKKYLWHSFFTDRYENASATYAYADFLTLEKVILNQKKEDGTLFTERDVIIFNRQKNPVVSTEQLIEARWPVKRNTLSRGIMCVFYRLGAKDFADGRRLDRDQLESSKRHYHHVYPHDLLEKASVDGNFVLNCALITDKTNLNISNKAPYDYLFERYEWSDEEIVHDRLNSHLIPIDELKNGGYEGLNEEEKYEKVAEDFLAFIQRRASLVNSAIGLLLEGRDITPEIVFNRNTPPQ